MKKDIRFQRSFVFITRLCQNMVTFSYDFLLYLSWIMINVLRFRFKIAKKVIYRLYIYFFSSTDFFLFQFWTLFMLYFAGFDKRNFNCSVQWTVFKHQNRKTWTNFFSFHALIINYVFKRLFADIYILFCVAD